MNNLRRYIRNSSWSLLRLGITAVVNLVLIAYFVRNLGAEVFGIWALIRIFSVSGGVLSIVDLGLQDAILRYLTLYRASGDPAQYKKLLVSGLAVFSGLGLMAAVVMFTVAGWLSTSVFEIPVQLQVISRDAFTIFALGLLIGFPTLVLKSFFRSQEDFKRLELWEMAQTAGFAVVALIMISLEASLPQIVLAEVVLLFVLMPVFAATAKMTYSQWFSLNPRLFSFDSLREIYEMSILVFTNRLLGLVYRRGPQFLIGMYLAPTNVTAFTVSQRLVVFVKQIQGTFNGVLLPMVVRLRTEEKQSSIQRAILDGTRFSFVLFMPLIVYLALNANAVMGVWLGDNLSVLGPFLQAFLAMQAMELATSFGSSANVTKRQFRMLIWPNLVVPVIFFSVTLGIGLEDDLWPAIYGLIASALTLLPWQLSIILRTNELRFRDYFKIVILRPVLLFGLCAAGTTYALHALIAPMSLAIIFWQLAVLYAVHFALFWVIDLQKHERETLFKILTTADDSRP